MKILNLKQAAEKTALSKDTVSRLVKEGKFPIPVQLSEGRHGWRDSEINQWIKDLPRKKY